MIGAKDKYALVTGASSGIGYEFAKLFAKDGKNLVVVARSQDKLEALKTEIENKWGTSVVVLPRDLSDPNAPQEIFSELESQNIDVDVLVNNAGFTGYGMFAETELQRELEMIQVNVISVVHLTKLFLNKMMRNKSGKILNVASLVAFVPTPLESVYSGTKSFVLNFTEALANEVKGTGVSVTCLCPGIPGVAKTSFYKRANMDNIRAAKLPMMDAARVAKDGYIALRKGKVIALPGLLNRLVPFLVRITPRNMLARMARASMEPA